MRWSRISIRNLVCFRYYDFTIYRETYSYRKIIFSDFFLFFNFYIFTIVFGLKFQHYALFSHKQRSINFYDFDYCE